VAKLLEYQGKELLKRCGIPIPPGQVVHSVQEAEMAAAQLGYPVMVKAQIYAGKRGKSGGVRRVEGPAELAAAAGALAIDRSLVWTPGGRHQV